MIGRWISICMALFSLCMAVPLLAGEADEATRLLDEAKALREKGQYARALPLAERAVALREKVQGTESLGVAAALQELGWILAEQGAYAKGQAALLRALFLQETRLGPDHLDVAVTLLRLGHLQARQGLLRKAGPSLDRALRIRQAQLGPEHPDVAAVLAQQGHCLRRRGEYERAEEALRRAIVIYEKFPQHDPWSMALAIGNLGILVRWAHGDYEEAERLGQRSLQIRESAFGPHHPVVAASLQALSGIHSTQGDGERAAALLARAVQINLSALGADHPDTAEAMIDLAAVLSRDLGQHKRAEGLLTQAIAAMERTLGTEDYRLAGALGALGDVHRRQGASERAGPLILRGLLMREAANGPTDPTLVPFLNLLGLTYHAQGALAAAEPLYQRAIRIREDAPARMSAAPMALASYSLLLLSQRRLAEARPLLGRLLEIGEQRLRAERRTLSEARLASLLDLLRHNEEVLYAWAQLEPASKEAQQLALATALLNKGRSLDEMAATSQIIAQSLAPEDRALFAELRTSYSRLAALSTAGPGAMPAPAYQARTRELAARADALEQRLASRSALIRAQRQLPGPGDILGRVAARIPADAALVEFVASHSFGARMEAGPEHLLALVLLPDQQLAAADLGPMAAIEDSAAELLAALRDPRLPYLAPAQRLARLVFDPLRAHLRGRRHLLLSTEGPLHFVPFAALHDGDEPLLSRFRFTYLTSGRDLLREPAAAPATTIAVLADPLFSQAAPGPAGIGTARRDRALLLGNLSPLPGTRREAERIRALLPSATVLLGAAATEGSLLSLRAPGVLHVATHGLFVSDDGGGGGQRGFAAQHATAAHPLLRSALVLAGAQKPPQGDGPDGLATALELSTMDLWGTQLVVLSACDTGRGAVRRGQGVYGLRRALSIAGAETVVTSLWKVDDDATADLMGAFYGRLLQGGARTDALADAMTAMRARKPHPYYWAPFILLGQPGPLRGFTQTPPQAPPR